MQHKHLFKKYFIPSILFVLGGIIGFCLLFYSISIFQIKQIEIIGGTEDEKKIITPLLKGASTLTLQQAEIQRIIHMRILSMNIKESHIQFPNTLILVVNKEKPIAYLITDYGYLALASSGLILLKERSLNIPHPSISFSQSIHHSEYQTGQYIKFTTITNALTFIALLEGEGYATETVAIDSVDMIACKTRGFEVVFSQSRPVDLQSHEVKQITRQIKVGALRIERLDLRFDKPVVKLPQKNQQ